jgi:assimilatory nitrate reductase catalytic subunit
MAATQHLAIQPKADLTLFYCLAHWLIKHGCVKREYVEAHTSGFEAFCEFVKEFEPAKHLQTLGLEADEFERFARTVAKGKRVSFWWTMGVNQGHESTRTAQAIINIALMTGNIGRPGTGANSITGQCNAMGSRLFSNTTNLLGGHDFTKVEHRAKIARILDIPMDRIPNRPSLAYDQIMQGIEEGKIKALWMIATNGAHSWINQKRFQDAVRKLEFFVVQDMYASTESARLAHLILPAAGWGEKEGTFINSERRIGVSHKVSRAPGQALSDFSIFRLVAEYWGAGSLFRKWASPEAVFQLLKEVTKGQPCDITGVGGYSMIEECGGVQWPLVAGDKSYPEHMPAKERRLFEDGRFFTPDGRARFIFELPRTAPELADDAYPFILLTGRGTSAQWHTETRTAKSAILKKLHPKDLLLEIHPTDAQSLGIRDGSPAKISSRRATIQAIARVTATVKPGQVFLPMHSAVVNQLTLSVFDPYSRQPGYKHCAVKVERG